MSKEGKDAASDTPKRRRRKGGGLRVPSDNVPRPSTGSEESAAEMTVQPAEDPRLAVSVAYALGDDSDKAEAKAAAAASGALPAEEGSQALPLQESVDIDVDVDVDVDDFEDEDGAGAARAPIASSRKPLVSAPVADSRAATIIDESLAERAAELDTGPVVRAPSEPASKAPAGAAGKSTKRANERWPRVQTEALSDDDFETLVVDGEARAAAKRPEGAAELEDDDLPTKVSEVPMLIADADEGEGDADEGEGEGEGDGDADEGEGEGEDNVVGDGPPRAHRRPSTPPPVKLKPRREMSGESTGGDVVASDGATIPAAVAALEDRIGAPSALPRAAESGEILADELIEELDEQERLATSAQDSSAAEPEKKVPPPAPPGSASSSSASGAPAPAPTPAPKPRRKPKPWFEEIFDEDYLRTLPFLTPQTTQAEANFVIDSLASEPGAQILDVGCGYGRHAMELAARGYHVVGLDSSLPLLLRGADEAQRRGLNINFVHGDMRELSFDAQFDGAYCLFSTFGYFDDETNKRTAQNISRALKPGARFVIEVLNRDYIIGDLPSRVWWEGDGCVVLEEVEFNYFSSRILSHRSVVFDDGHQLEQEISIRAYSLHELGKLLHAGGFRVIEISGGMHSRGRFFGGRSRDIVVVAERRAGTSDENKRAKTEAGVGKL